MLINATAKAGTEEKSDIVIEVSPIASGIEIELRSPVKLLFGEQIKQTIHSTVEALNFEGVRVRAQDYSALDCVIAARTETALLRAARTGGNE